MDKKIISIAGADFEVICRECLDSIEVWRIRCVQTGEYIFINADTLSDTAF